MVLNYICRLFKQSIATQIAIVTETILGGDLVTSASFSSLSQGRGSGKDVVLVDEQKILPSLFNRQYKAMIHGRVGQPNYHAVY